VLASDESSWLLDAAKKIGLCKLVEAKIRYTPGVPAILNHYYIAASNHPQRR